MRKPITAKVRRIVWGKYDGTCAYCGKNVEYRSDDRYRRMQVDHIVPVEFGGTNDLDNLNPSCHSCNYAKGCFDLERYRAYCIAKREDAPFFTLPQVRWLAKHLRIEVTEILEREHGPYLFAFEVIEIE